MNMVFAPILAAAVIGQIQGGMVEGRVVDGGGNPIAEAPVVLYSPFARMIGNRSNFDPLEVQGRTDRDGRFALKAFAQGRFFTAWTYKPGLAIAAAPSQAGSHAYVLALRTSDPRVIKITGADGQPVPGARVTPRTIYFGSDTPTAAVPPALAEALAVTTGPGGTVPIAYLGGLEQLVAARISADAIGSQDVQLVERPAQSAVATTIAIRIGKTSRIVGKVVDQDGRGLPSQAVDVWSKPVPGVVGASPLEFKTGPVRTGADGSFQTPEILMADSTYRVTVRGYNSEPVDSDWITMAGTPVSLAPLVLRSFRTITGRIVDRQGKPVANAEVFPPAEGMKRTSVKTNADGRFELGGVRRGPAFVLARAAGFRFCGQVLKPSESEVTVELTRSSERPAREMKKLPDPIPLAESRALARRLLDPWWQAAALRGDDNTRFSVLRMMARADPAGMLQRLATAKVPDGKARSLLQSKAARALAETDLEEAEAVAESITDAGIRAGTMARLADMLPLAERGRKVALLGRAAIHAGAAIDPSDRMRQLGDVAVRLQEVGETERAKALFAEGDRLAHEFKSQSLWANAFPGRLARVDLPEALKLAKSRMGDRLYVRIVSGIAFNLAWDQPAQVRQFLDQCPVETARDWLIPAVTWKIATCDPVRARQLLDSLPVAPGRTELEFCLALGAKERDETVSQEALAAGMHELDRLMQEAPPRSSQVACQMLPFAEAIEPALVPEVLWRSVASSNSPSYARYLAWYDRDLAAVVFEPARQRLETAGNKVPADVAMVFEAWSLFDPRAAVARLEQTPITSIDPNNNDNYGRLSVIETLSLPHEERWHRIWHTWESIFNPLNRDILADRF
jgi:hypothetical protein